jgi:hypothetical protein
VRYALLHREIVPVIWFPEFDGEYKDRDRIIERRHLEDLIEEPFLVYDEPLE